LGFSERTYASHRGEKTDIDQVFARRFHIAWRSNPSLAKRYGGGLSIPEADNYLARLIELDRRVLLRYQVDDPFQALGDDRWYGLPSYAAGDSGSYAHSLLEIWPDT